MLLDLLFGLWEAIVQNGYVTVSDSGNRLMGNPTASNGINNYIVGNLVVLSAVFLDHNKNPADPAIVTLCVGNPDGTINSYQFGASDIIKDGVGLYHFVVPNNQPGYYYYRFKGGGNIICAQGFQFNSVGSPFGGQC